jgi:hypothetical protein
MFRRLGLTDRELIAQAVPAQQMGANATVNGAALDMTGWDGLTVVLSVGGGDKTVNARLQYSDDGTTWADVPGAAITQIASNVTNVQAVIDAYRLTKRYARLVVTTGAGGSANRDVSAVAIRHGCSGTLPPAQVVGEVVKVIQS